MKQIPLILLIACLLMAAGYAVCHLTQDRGLPAEEAERLQAEADTVAARAARQLQAVRDSVATETARLEEERERIADERREADARAAQAQRRSNAAIAEAVRLRELYEANPTLEACHDALGSCQAATVVLQAQVEAERESHVATERQLENCSQRHVLCQREVSALESAYAEERRARGLTVEAYELQAQATASERARGNRYKTALIVGVPAAFAFAIIFTN